MSCSWEKLQENSPAGVDARPALSPHTRPDSHRPTVNRHARPAAMALGQQEESNVSMRVGNEHVGDKTILDLLLGLMFENPIAMGQYTTVLGLHDIFFYGFCHSNRLG